MLTSAGGKKRNPTIDDFVFPAGLPKMADLPCSSDEVLRPIGHLYILIDLLLGSWLLSVVETFLVAGLFLLLWSLEMGFIG